MTGLYNFRNRDYSPTLGRWLSVDPLGFGAGDNNFYRAEGNGPAGATDPSGLEGEGLLKTIFSWDTLWFCIGQRPDGHGGHEAINGGVYKSFTKDQATNLMIALPQTRTGTLLGGGYSILSQGAANVGDARQGRPLRGYDSGKTQDMMLFGGALQWPLTRVPQLGYPLIGLGFEQGGEKIWRGDYEEGAVDLGFAGLGAYAMRGQAAKDVNWLQVKGKWLRIHTLDSVGLPDVSSEVPPLASLIDPATPRIVRGTNPSRVTFDGMEVRAVRDLSHLDEGTLRAMQQRGFAATDINGQPLQLHHLGQNPAGPLVEIPAPGHNIGNRVQHPFGNQPGAVLTAEQRAAFSDWRTRYWQERAGEELARRGLQ